MKEEMEQTLVLIKPDALKNSVTGYILSQLSGFHTGLHFAAAKIVAVSRMLAAEHYAEHKAKPFFASLLDYIMGAEHYPDAPQARRVVAFVYQGPQAVSRIREVCGPTNPHAAREQKPGTIRSLGTVVDVKDASGKVVDIRMDNLIHASSSAADAEREIKLWFEPNDIPPLMNAYAVAECADYFFYKEGKLLKAHEPGASLLAAPGDILWASDYEALKAISSGKPGSVSLETVAAKYLINRK
jgi:nucleoside-diphosphate kinase